MKILVLNAGSSSLKTCLYELPAEAPRPLWEARADWSHHAGTAEVRIRAVSGAVVEQQIPISSPVAVLDPVLQSLWSGPARMIQDRSEIDLAGHRVVHGGKAFRQSTRVTPEVRAAIARLVEFAPAHNRLELEGMHEIDRILGPQFPQFAVFDTAFHADLPAAAFVYPGPYDWLEQGIRRYGFHGISHQYTARRSAEILARDLRSLRLITCHLGNGCSLAAIREGRSVDTTMGFTPLEGLMMGTRSGSVDPGILIHLLRHGGHAAERLDHILNEESGLKGISGLSGDMRQILDGVAQGNPRAILAFEIYVHRVRSGIGAMLASLGGIDALTFTAGVGENSARVREAAAGAFAFLGWKIDPAKNAQSPVDTDIAAPDSTVRILVVHTEEDWEIARECYRLAQA